MLGESVEYLRDPHLVARIQEFFGVRIEKARGAQDDWVKGRESEDTDKESRGESENKGKPKRGSEVQEHFQRHSDHIDKSNKQNGFVSSTEKPNGCSERFNEAHQRRPRDSDRETLQVARPEPPRYSIKNHFWYYLFLFGTELGDETFYSTFIPFWFWNIDGAVGRRVVLVWAIIMTIGQALKDIICWPRPSCPPAARLQSKWSQEYGMPSTHAMIGVSIPFSVVLFTMGRYTYPLSVGLAIATLWCALVSVSRLYLGMHTVLDVMAGLGLAAILMVPLVPLVDYTDRYFVTSSWALGLLVALSFATIVYYPRSDRWTPTRGDTAMVVSVTTGVHFGAWLNYQTGVLSSPILPPPYSIVWPSYPMLGRTLLRTIIGFCCIIATKTICKSVCYSTMCSVLRVDPKELMASKNSLENRNKVLVDLVYKYAFCFMIGLNTVYLLPHIFTGLGLERATFYTEM